MTRVWCRTKVLKLEMLRNPPEYTPKDLNLEGPGQRAGGAPHQWRGEIREGLWQRDLQSSHLKGKGVGEGPSSRPSEQPFRKARLVLGCVGNLRTAPLTADVVFVTHSLDRAPVLLQLPNVRREVGRGWPAETEFTGRVVQG